ncbi:MAG: translation initiation factor IF-2 [Sediminispirochaetaceae bacterium]
MAEEQEKNQEKPKATLIKHKKPAAAASSQSDQTDKKSEKKKVVVVRKKKKPVQKVAVKPVKEQKEEEQSRAESAAAGKAPEQEQAGSVSAKDEQAAVKSQPQTRTEGASADRRGPQTRSANGGRDTRGPRDTTQGRRPQPPRREPASGGRDRRPDSQRPSDRNFRGRRPSGPGAPSGNRGGDTRRGEARPDSRSRTFKKPGTPQGGAPAAPAAQELGKKTPSKKFFKSKKKTDYHVKHNREKEKDFQIKRKPQHKKANPVPKEIDIMEVITVSELARKMNLKASELIGKLMGMGMMVTINQQIDAETAEILASEYNCKVNIVSLYDETIIETEDDRAEDLKPRPPIVTVMGHVDHGKTKLLDAIRSTDVVAGEHGGITQHIGAYKVKLKSGSGEVVFLDTPGHAAFTLMRARGAQVTDIVILVVAANDGVMPQTVEAINHAKEAGVPIIVAVNKIDLPEANIDRIKQQLSEYNLLPEDWGGTTLFNEISALNKIGIDELLESIMLQAEILELKSNYNCRAEGKIIESKVDHGRGIVSTVIIERGTLKVGDAFVAGIYPGKVRAMFDDKGQKIDEATPATPVEILGFTGIPDAGSPFQVTENERQARQVGAKRQELEKQGEAQNVKKITLDNLYDSIQEGEIQELKVIIKGDVHGSVEALQTALEKLSTKDIKLRVIHASAGAIIENDVNLATTSNAIIVGFHVRPTPKALELAEKEKIDIRKYNVIYDVVNDIKSAMEGMLAPDLKEEVIGNVEVRDIFKVPKIGVIAGCYVTNGKIKRNSSVHIIRDGIQIFTGKVSSLKRFKDDAREVEAGYECGIGIESFNDLKVGDQFEVFEIREIAKTLE